MTQKIEQEGASMFARRAAGMKLISESIALAIGRLVLEQQHGEEELRLNSPLTAKAAGDVWIVTGSVPDVGYIDRNPPYQGPFEMRISQFSGQIFDCFFQIDWKTAAATAISRDSKRAEE
jgi:hypothetical protein